MKDWDIINKYNSENKTDEDIILYYKKYQDDAEFRARVEVYLDFQNWTKIHQKRPLIRGRLIGLTLGLTLLFLILYFVISRPPSSSVEGSGIYAFNFIDTIKMEAPIARWFRESGGEKSLNFNNKFDKSGTLTALNRRQKRHKVVEISSARALLNIAIQVDRDLNNKIAESVRIMGNAEDVSLKHFLLPGEEEFLKGDIEKAVIKCNNYGNTVGIDSIAFTLFYKYAQKYFHEKKYEDALYCYEIYIENENIRDVWLDRHESESRLREVLCILADWSNQKNKYPAAISELKNNIWPVYKIYVQKIEDAVSQHK